MHLLSLKQNLSSFSAYMDWEQISKNEPIHL